jgi:hypothetical protein
MEIPNFLKLDGESLVFNLDNKEFVFYVPENFFNDKTKRPIAEIIGEDVSMIGLCNWAIIDSNGKVGNINNFCFPTMMLCSPYEVEKVKNFKLTSTSTPGDFRILHFKKGDKVVKQIRVPQIIDNTELFFKLVVITSKMPETIPYDDIWELFLENAQLNGFNYGLHSQLFGIIVSELCRDPNNFKKAYRLTNNSNKPTGYKTISIKYLPKFVSPYVSLTSENFDDALRSSILMSDIPEEDIPYSPLEKVIMQ